MYQLNQCRFWHVGQLLGVSFEQPLVSLGFCKCRVPTSLRPIFEADADKDALYSEEVVCSALRAYTEREGLSLGDGALKLDKLLVGHLFNKKEPQQEGDSHPFDDVMRRLLSKLAMFHTISRSTPGVHPVA